MIISQNRYEIISKLKLTNGQCAFSHMSCGEYINGLYKVKYQDLAEIENDCVFDINNLRELKVEKINVGLINTIYEHYKNIFLKYNINNYEIEIVEIDGFKIFQSERKCLIEPIKRYSINFSVYSLINMQNYERGFGGTTLDKILNLEKKVEELIKVSLTKCLCMEVKGNYPVIFDNEMTGLFAHEIVGHNLEADIWSLNTKLDERFKLGEKVSSSELNIVDNPLLNSESGTYLFDDEGNVPHLTYLIKNGVINHLLTNEKYSNLYKIVNTGNARSISPFYKPIIRMSNTYVMQGKSDVKSLFSMISYGFYFKGTRNSKGGIHPFIEPREVYLIKNGKIKNLVSPISISEDALSLLQKVKGIGNDFEIYGGGKGGCGKYNQFPLPVSSGGPHILLDNVFINNI